MEEKKNHQKANVRGMTLPFHGLFLHEKMTERIIKIIDVSMTAMYLILGDDKTALIDTGIGSGNVRKYIGDILGKTVDLVILTHGHMDHASGAILFHDVPVYLNEQDRELMNIHVTDRERRKKYTLDMQKRIPFSVPSFTDADILDGDDCAGTIPLHDGDRFDLGGITLEAIHAPSHTQGMTAFLIPEERILLLGDACGENVLLTEDCCSTVEEYRETLRKILKYEDRYDRIFRNHGTGQSSKALVENVIEVCTKILEGRDDQIPENTVLDSGYQANRAKALSPDRRGRMDGKEGNIIYAENKIR